MGEAANKPNVDFVADSFGIESTVERYTQAVTAVGLWKSEEIMFQKYLPKQGQVLDLGCGAGRTTFGLFERGYKYLTGVDISPGMIRAAKEAVAELGKNIRFIVGNACNLPFPDATFDGSLFSFNGLMQIPDRQVRVAALSEIRRVHKAGAHFIFTTHDREKESQWRPFWECESRRWEKGEQDRRLHEFGDRIIEEEERAIFLHFPNRAEVIDCIKEAGFVLVEDIWRPDLVDESPAVKEFSTECRFWVVRKR